MSRPCRQGHSAALHTMSGMLLRYSRFMLYLLDAEASGGAALVVEQHLRQVHRHGHRHLDVAQVVEEPARRQAAAVACVRQESGQCGEHSVYSYCAAKTCVFGKWFASLCRPCKLCMCNRNPTSQPACCYRSSVKPPYGIVCAGTQPANRHTLQNPFFLGQEWFVHVMMKALHGA